MTEENKIPKEFSQSMRTQFYRDNFGRLVMVVILLVLINAGLSFFSFYLYNNQPTPKYFATTANGELIEIKPLSHPLLSINQLLTWSVEASTAAYTFDFFNYKAQLQDVRKYFTQAGFDNFLAALEQSDNINQIRAKKLVISSVPTGAPVVLEEGLIKDRYTWRVQLPMRLSFQSANEVSSQDVIITMLITRVPTLESERGVGIAQFVVVSK